MTRRKLILCSLVSLAVLGAGYYVTKVRTKTETLSGQLPPGTTVDPLPEPTLSETLQYLGGASEASSGYGYGHISFESHGCSVTIIDSHLYPPSLVSSRTVISFSLGDIDPNIEVDDEGKLGFPGRAEVIFNTTNFVKKITGTSDVWEFPASAYDLEMNAGYAPHFAKAFKHAVELCGGKRSAF